MFDIPMLRIPLIVKPSVDGSQHQSATVEDVPKQYEGKKIDVYEAAKHPPKATSGERREYEKQCEKHYL
jgi:hypothetical protein